MFHTNFSFSAFSSYIVELFRACGYRSVYKSSKYKEDIDLLIKHVVVIIIYNYSIIIVIDIVLDIVLELFIN